MFLIILCLFPLTALSILRYELKFVLLMKVELMVFLKPKTRSIFNSLEYTKMETSVYLL